MKVKILLLTVVLTSVMILLGFAIKPHQLEYDTKYTEMMVDGFLQTEFLRSEASTVYAEGIQSGKISDMSHFSAYCDHFAIHGLLPEREQLKSGLQDPLTRIDEISNFNINDDVLALAVELMDYYSSQIKYSIVASSEGVSHRYPKGMFYDESLAKGLKNQQIPLVLGTVTLEIEQIDIAQGIDRSKFDKIWLDLEQNNWSKSDLRNAYLQQILTMLLENIQQGEAVVYSKTQQYAVPIILSTDAYSGETNYAIERTRMNQYSDLNDWVETTNMDFDLEHVLFNFTGI